MKNRIQNTVSWVLLSTITAVLIVILVLLLYPFKLLEFEHEKFPVLTPVVEQGDNLKFQAAFTKHTTATPSINRELVNTYLYFFPANMGVLPSGEYDRVITIPIPSYAEPGTYYLRTTYAFDICFIRTVIYEHDTELFEVVKKKGN